MEDGSVGRKTSPTTYRTTQFISRNTQYPQAPAEILLPQLVECSTLFNLHTEPTLHPTISGRHNHVTTPSLEHTHTVATSLFKPQVMSQNSTTIMCNMNQYVVFSIIISISLVNSRGNYKNIHRTSISFFTSFHLVTFNLRVNFVLSNTTRKLKIMNSCVVIVYAFALAFLHIIYCTISKRLHFVIILVIY